MNTSPLRRSILLSTLPLLLLISGCATVDQKVTLSYAPIDHSFGRHDVHLTLARIDAPVSSRNSRGEWIIGSLNNVHGVHQADLLSDRSLGEWISEALTLELKQAGFTVSPSANYPVSAPRVLLISGIKGFLNIDNGLFSTDTSHELKFNLELLENGTKTKAFTLVSRDTQTFLLLASRQAKEQVLLRSLQDAIRQILPDLITLTAHH